RNFIFVTKTDKTFLVKILNVKKTFLEQIFSDQAGKDHESNFHFKNKIMNLISGNLNYCIRIFWAKINFNCFTIKCIYWRNAFCIYIFDLPVLTPKLGQYVYHNRAMMHLTSLLFIKAEIMHRSIRLLSHLQRSSTGTFLRACSICIPHPAHVGLLQVLHQINNE
ncbi:hypothetical protein BpHYR1_021488, partial [Brachionus plicatilis]